MSYARTTTYHYNSKTSELVLKEPFDRLTIAATPSTKSLSTPTLTYCSTPATTPTSSPEPTPANMTRTRTVNFGPIEGAREPFWDEQDVMKKFNSHVKRCNDCYNSLSSWRSGEPLCSRGHAYFVDMNPYFTNINGKLYSVIDNEKRRERNRILVPPEMQHVNTLFEAVNHGYAPGASRRRSQPRPVVVHIHPQPQPRPTHSRHQEREVIVVPGDSRRQAHRERYYEERRSRTDTERPQYIQREPRRGSLYHEDERRRHRHHEEVIVVPADRVRYR